MSTVALRTATPADVAIIMAAERLPEAAAYVSRWNEARHLAGIAGDTTAYLIGGRGAEPEGFAILGDLDESNGNVLLYRIVSVRPGTGFGGPFLSAVVDWTFRYTAAHRLWLDVVADNARARHVYERAGFVAEGVMRQSYVTVAGERVDLAIMSLLRPEWERLRDAG